MNEDLLKLHMKRDQDAKTTLLPDGYVAIMKLGSSVGHTLSPLGALLWELCDGTLTVGEVVCAIEEVGGSEVRELLQDSAKRASLVDLVKNLENTGFLVVTQP
jgi:hypothetical protein